MCMEIVEFLIADNTPVSSFDHPGISLKLETWRFPFPLQFLRRHRDGRIAICCTNVKDELCDGFYIRPLSGLQVKVRIKQRFNYFSLCVHSILSIYPHRGRVVSFTNSVPSILRARGPYKVHSSGVPHGSSNCASALH